MSKTERPAVPPADSEPVSALLVEIATLAWKATGGTPGIDPTDAWNELCTLLERQPDSFPDDLAALAARGVPPDKQAGT